MPSVNVGGNSLSFASSRTVGIAAVKTSQGKEFFVKGAGDGTLAVQQELLRRFKDAQIQLVACTPQKQQAGLDYHVIGKTLDEAEWKSQGFEFSNRNRVRFFDTLAVIPDFSEPLPRYEFCFDNVTSLLQRLNNAHRFYEMQGTKDPDSVLLENKVVFMLSELGIKPADDIVSSVIGNQGVLFPKDLSFRGYSHVSQFSDAQLGILNAILDCNENLYAGLIYNPWLFEAYRNHEASLTSDPLGEYAVPSQIGTEPSL